MTDEAGRLTREDIEQSLTGITVATYCPQAKYDMPLGDLVHDLGTDRFESVALGNVVADNYTDVPVYWRLVVPATAPDLPIGQQKGKLAKIAFGIETGVPGPLERIASPDDQKREIDRGLQRMLGIHEEVRQLQIHVKDDIATRVSFAGEPLFAGIERRCRFDDKGEPVNTWSQLIYSKYLLRTPEALGRRIKTMKKEMRVPPRWLQEAAMRRHNREKVAELMALSVLALTLHKEDESKL